MFFHFYSLVVTTKPVPNAHAPLPTNDRIASIVDKLKSQQDTNDALKNDDEGKKVGADYLEASTKNYVNSVSNLLNVGTTVQEEPSKSTDGDTVVNTDRVSALNGYIGAISQKRVPGKKASTGKTDSFNYAMKKVTAKDFTNGESGVEEESKLTDSATGETAEMDNKEEEKARPLVNVQKRGKNERARNGRKMMPGNASLQKNEAGEE